MRFPTLALAILFLLSEAARADFLSHSTVSLTANSIVFDPATQLLYASTSSGITAINPTTGAIVGSYAVGNNPGQLVIGASGGVIYAQLGTQISGQNAVLPFNTITHTAGSPILIAAPNTVTSMSVSPVNSNVIAIATTNPNFSPGFAGVTVYNNGTAGPINNSVTANNITFSSKWPKLVRLQ